VGTHLAGGVGEVAPPCGLLQQTGCFNNSIILSDFSIQWLWGRTWPEASVKLRRGSFGSVRANSGS
jgi:hypothetical protein